MNLDFDGRVFLTEAEHQTYLRRMPVRFTKFDRSQNCCICGLPGTPENPIQAAHVIGFNYGVKLLRLTPDYLDSPENLKPVHRSTCNKSVELSIEAAIELVKNLT